MFRSGPVLIIIAAFLWGLDGILRRSLFSLPPITIVFYEHLIGAALILPFALPLLRREKITRREWLVLLFIALLSGVLGTWWFTTALSQVNFISFSVVFLLQKLQPLFAVVAAALLLGERLTRRYAGWAALAVLAAYFVTFPGGRVDLTTGAGTAIAALYAVGAAFAWGTSTAFSRFTLLKHSPTLITGLRFLLTTPLALLFLLAIRQAPSLAAPAPAQYAPLLLIAFSSGLVALWIYYRGLKRTQAKISTILELFFPLTAVAIDVILYDTVLAPGQYLAAAILLFAMYRISLLDQSGKTFRAAVIPGKSRGRGLGFPTFNLRLPTDLTAEEGIYAGWVHLDGRRYPGAFHFGPVPTFAELERSLEVHIIGGSFSAAPAELDFELVSWIREVRPFATPEKLAAQIAADVRDISAVLGNGPTEP